LFCGYSRNIVYRLHFFNNAASRAYPLVKVESILFSLLFGFRFEEAKKAFLLTLALLLTLDLLNLIMLIKKLLINSKRHFFFAKVAVAG
jgi:hypothetical protein